MTEPINKAELTRRRFNEYEVPAIMIDTWSSTCAYCGLGADPEKKRHTKVMSMNSAEHGKKACGKQYKYTTSNYSGTQVEAWCKDMRPDLPYIDLFTMMQLSKPVTAELEAAGVQPYTPLPSEHKTAKPLASPKSAQLNQRSKE